MDPRDGYGCADYLNPWVFVGMAGAAVAFAVVLFVRAGKSGSVSASEARPGPS